jgi:hypothetical protein
VREREQLRETNLLIILGYIRQSIEILLSLKDEQGGVDSSISEDSFLKKGRNFMVFHRFRVENARLQFRE